MLVSPYLNLKEMLAISWGHNKITLLIGIQFRVIISGIEVSVCFYIILSLMSMVWALEMDVDDSALRSTFLVVLILPAGFLFLHFIAFLHIFCLSKDSVIRPLLLY